MGHPLRSDFRPTLEFILGITDGLPVKLSRTGDERLWPHRLGPTPILQSRVRRLSYGMHSEL
jgi:hypothetical protein